MKLESIKNSKFAAFKSSVVMNSFKIVGGEPIATTYRSSDKTTGCDVNDSETEDGPWTDESTGKKTDYSRAVCPEQ